MNLNKTIESIESGFNDVATTLYRIVLTDEQMATYKLRRRQTEVPTHRVWVLTIGESGQTPVAFYGHTPGDCFKAALAWRGLPTSSRRKTAPAAG